MMHTKLAKVKETISLALHQVKIEAHFFHSFTTKDMKKESELSMDTVLSHN